MRTLPTSEAEDLARWRNRTAAHNPNVAVVVDGPNDGEATVMTLREAIENEFAYRWETR